MAANNNNDNNSSSSSLLPPDKERQEQETIVLWEFRNAFQNCHERLLMDDDTTGELLTDDEHSAIERLYSDPTWYCVGAGLLTLGLLRTGRYVRRYRVERYNNRSGYTLDRRPPQGGSMPPPQQTPASFFSWKTVLVDIVLCSFAGAVTGTYMVDMHEAKGGLDQLALVPGRSGVANEFCPAILEEYQEQWKQQQQMSENNNSNNSSMVSIADSGEEDTQDINDNNATNTATIVDLGVVSVQIQADPIPPDAHKEILQNPNNPNLQAYLRFAKNCKARHAMERQLRKDWGLSEKASVAIPPPGVVIVRDDDGYADGDDEWEPSNKKSSADDGEWTQDEASSWVSDQEDEKR